MERHEYIYPSEITKQEDGVKGRNLTMEGLTKDAKSQHAVPRYSQDDGVAG